MTILNINSSDGRIRVTCNLLRRFTSDSDVDCILTSVEIEENFWPIDVSLEDANLREEVHVRLPQMAFGREALRDISHSLSNWLACPFEFECCLVNERDQRMTIRFGREDMLISSVERPVCTLNYSFGSRHQAKTAFVVDQSCMQILHDDICSAFAN